MALQNYEVLNQGGLKPLLHFWALSKSNELDLVLLL